MIKTHLTAKQALIDGMGTDAAFAIAQQDEGLLPHVTKEIWVREMGRIIEREMGCNAAYADPMHY